MSSETSPQERAVIRATTGYWYFGAAAAICLFLLGDAAVRGAWDVVAVTLPWMALVLWIIWLLLVRPAVIVTRDAFVVRNILREWSVPWPRIRHLLPRYQLGVELRDGSLIRSWGAPSTGVDRPSVIRDRKPAERHPKRTTAQLIEDTREQLTPGELDDTLRAGTPEVTVRWQLTPVVVLVALVAACIASTWL